MSTDHTPPADRIANESTASPDVATRAGQNLTFTAVPPADRAALRDRIADAIRDAACPGGDCPLTEAECSEQRIQPAAWERGVLSEVYGRPEWFADAVLAVLPEVADRAAEVANLRTMYGAATAREHELIEERDKLARWHREDEAALAEMRGPCSAGDHCCKGPTPSKPEAEDPARIDRLRPEFFEHASVESIDFQIQRARRQQRHWGNRERTLGILRQARITQKENGEWPAGVGQDGAQPAAVVEPGKEAR